MSSVEEQLDETKLTTQDSATQGTAARGTATQGKAKMGDSINKPPLSGSKSMKCRPSKSTTYDKSEQEWHWKLTAILPKLWIRDASKITEEITEELDAAWLRYQTLRISGKGDGSDWKANFVKQRRLKEEYSKLDDDVRRAKEVALARYPNFVICGTDGSLDYHTDERQREDGGAVGKVLGKLRKKKVAE